MEMPYNKDNLQVIWNLLPELEMQSKILVCL